ncbi:MAG: hypothetical protein IIA45_11930 [Bacteroidetes bacterium]|nr:hypothetical protein [Bacteroidota bacterium]
MDIKKTDVEAFLNDKQFINELIKEIKNNPEVVRELAEEIAEEISDYLQDDPELKRKIIESAMVSHEFREKVVREIVNEMND